MQTKFEANKGKVLEKAVRGETFLRVPLRTRLINAGDDLLQLLTEYAAPHLRAGDLLFVSEKIVCITQNRMLPIKDIQTSWLARLLSGQVRNHVGTPEFRGLGHGTAPAMQLFIEEAGYPRIFLALLAAVLTRPFGIKGAFYFVSGKRAKSVDCPMSWTLSPYTEYAKRAPEDPDGVARTLAERFGADVIIVDANYRGAFSLGKSNYRITERFIREVLADNPAGQDSEMTPFMIVRKAHNEMSRNF